jgi:tRNA threonylcarbamoyladenosine biosynthesis protein TsaB
MNILGLDTATGATAVALARADGWIAEARDDVAAGERPHHSQRLLALAAELVARAGISWRSVDAVAVGVGPGGYTGLRIGLATARGLAWSLGAGLLGVGTLRALAEPVPAGAVASVIDARRGEAFIAVYRDGDELVAPTVCAPHELAALAGRGGPGTLAVGDGALRFRSFLEAGGIAVAPAASERHRISAAAVCRLAASGSATAPVPDYLRLADAERSQEAHTT